MIKNEKKCIEILLVTGIVFIMLCSLVSAIGFSYGYGKKNLLTVYPGETKIVQIPLQTIKTEEIRAKVILLDDGGIASIEDKEYLISSEKEGIVDVRLVIPNDAVVGSEYTVTLEFREINPTAGEGTVGLVASIAGLDMHAYVIERPAEEEPEQPAEEGLGATWLLLLVIVVVAVIAITYFIIKNRRNKPVGKEAKKAEKPEEAEKPVK